MIKVDHFVSRLWKLYKDSLENGYNQTINLSIFRCDYMLHEENENKSDNNNNNKSRYTMKQVEMNTIAAGFGYVSTKASLLHRYF